MASQNFVIFFAQPFQSLKIAGVRIMIESTNPGKKYGLTTLKNVSVIFTQ